MSSGRQIPVRDGKIAAPVSSHPDVANRSVPPNNRYSLNLKAPSSASSPSYQAWLQLFASGYCAFNWNIAYLSRTPTTIDTNILKFIFNGVS